MSEKTYYELNRDHIKLQQKICKGCINRPRGKWCDQWDKCRMEYEVEHQEKKNRTVKPSVANGDQNPLVVRPITDDGVNPYDALFYIADMLHDIYGQLVLLNEQLRAMNRKGPS